MIKRLAVFSAVFFCAAASLAQGIEVVSYAPVKSGNFQYISVKRNAKLAQKYGNVIVRGGKFISNSTRLILDTPYLAASNINTTGNLYSFAQLVSGSTDVAIMTLRPNSRFYLFNGGTMQIAQVLRDTSEFPSNLIHDSINVTARTVNMPYQYGVFVNTISPASFVENMHIAGRTFPTKNFALRPDGFPSNPRIYWWKVSASYVPDCTIGDEKFNNISVFDAACNSTAPLALIDLYVAAFCQRSGGCGT